MPKEMRVVVVGATGNVGTAVLERLHGEPDILRLEGIARRLPDDSLWPYSGVGWHSVDIAAPDAVARLTEVFRGADAVISLAWLLQSAHDEGTLWATNVEGTMHVVQAAADAGVPQVVYASSIGAYSPGPKKRRVDESWPTDGIRSSHYSREKAEVERRLTRFEAEHPQLTVTRIRPGLVMQGKAATEVKSLFLGPLVPIGPILRAGVPIVPLPTKTISQVVHADDLADVFWRAIDHRAGGAFNVAAEPVIDPARLAKLLGARWLRVRARPVRALVNAAWKLRLLPMDPGWLDLATNAPVMSTERARTELGWEPKISGLAAIQEVVDGLKTGEGHAGSPKLTAAAKSHA